MDSSKNSSAVFPFANSESGYAPFVSEKPGLPQISLSPAAFNVSINTDTVLQNLVVTNNGSRDLFVDIPQGMANTALRCDGSYDYVYTADYAQHEGMTAFTLEARVKRIVIGYTYDRINYNWLFGKNAGISFNPIITG